MSRPRLLDLYCCSGGAAVGYARAGFEVVGVDIKPRPDYPFEFIEADALSLDPAFVRSFDGIHASPPCQRFSITKSMTGRGGDHPDLIEPTRAMLRESGLPFVIENVVGAPLADPFTLCGTMFGLQVYRHRLFETSFFVLAPPTSSTDTRPVRTVAIRKATVSSASLATTSGARTERGQWALIGP